MSLAPVQKKVEDERQRQERVDGRVAALEGEHFSLLMWLAGISFTTDFSAVDVALPLAFNDSSGPNWPPSLLFFSSGLFQSSVRISVRLTLSAST